MFKKTIATLLLASFAAGLTACGAAPAPSAAPAAATPAATIQATATPEPTATPVPTPAPTAEPTATPSAAPAASVAPMPDATPATSADALDPTALFAAFDQVESIAYEMVAKGSDEGAVTAVMFLDPLAAHVNAKMKINGEQNEFEVFVKDDMVYTRAGDDWSSTELGDDGLAALDIRAALAAAVSPDEFKTMKKTGEETVGGFAAVKYEGKTANAQVTLWVDKATGLVVKLNAKMAEGEQELTVVSINDCEEIKVPEAAL